jgi:PhoH-like ATPase
MRKIYVLDTNCVLADPMAIYAFGDNEVVLPSVLLEEVDSKKKLADELGRNARHFSRELDKLRETGALHEGVPLENGGTLRVEFHKADSPIFEAFLDTKNDNAIIAIAHHLKEVSPDAEVIMVSKDTLVRIKADTVSVRAEDYQHDKVAHSEDELYKGYSVVHVEDEVIDGFYADKFIKAGKQFKDYPENHLFVLKSFDETKSAIARKVIDKRINKLVPLYNYKEKEEVFGIKAKNVEQKMALELLLDDDVPLVTLSGKAGTGKTLLALAAALKKTLDEEVYDRILVARPVVPMGKDIGYLPGEKEEKLRPWMQPIYDNLEFLFGSKNEAELNKTLSGYEDNIKVEALTYIRGRSIPNQFIIIDEAQNLSKHEAKTIATRIGEGSKVVFVGDPHQIDSPYLDMYSNGLTHIIEKMKEEKVYGHVTLTRGERSTLAQLCADLL